MTCDSFLERVAELLDGGLTPSDREGLLAHVQVCAECRGLHAALAVAAAEPEDPDLSDAILARTSGAACGSARSRLCARLDGELERVEVDLVDRHLLRCPNCAGLARALERLPEELPLLATADPGPRFVEQVLLRTSQRPRKEPVGARIAAAVSRWFERPRIAWEGAFVATAVIVLPILAPGSPLAGLPSRALGLTRELPTVQRRALGELRGVTSDIEATWGSRASAAWTTTGAALVEHSIVATSDITQSFTTTWDRIRERLGTFPESDASGQKGDAPDANDRQRPKPPQETKR